MNVRIDWEQFCRKIDAKEVQFVETRQGIYQLVPVLNFNNTNVKKKSHAAHK